jgi:hypothetical protein
MKKLFIAGLFLFTVVSLSAQIKITKQSIIGKWAVAAVEVKDIIYYNVETDSLSLGAIMKAQLKDEQQAAAAVAMAKPALEMFAKSTFTFNENGTGELATGFETVQKVKYSVDEVNSTITTVQEDKKEDIMKAEMLTDRLRISVKQPQGDILMILKKAK